MTAAFSTTWHTFRLGLHALPTRRVAFSTLRLALRVAERQLGPARSRCALSQGGWCCLKQWQSTYSRPQIFHVFIKQSRWVSFWRPAPKEGILGEMTAESELSISAEDIEKVFGRKMDPKQGLDILLTLQRHRSGGTLDHKLPFSNALATKGLAYLRKVNPIDEDAAIIARIDQETDTTPQTNVERSPHAISQFEMLKRENEERRRLQDAQREVEEQKKLEEGARATSRQMRAKENKTTAPSNHLVGLRPEPAWVRNYRAKATNLDLQKTLMPVWARLLPSALVTIVVVGLAVVFAQNYIPPSKKARLWPDTPPAAATVITLIGLNCLVFLMWRLPPLWRSMNRNFLVAPVYPYSMSMLGAPFSHQSLHHLLVNVAFLWFIGTRVHDDIGRGSFLALYFSTAVIAAYVPMVVYVLKNELRATTLGASGAVCGLIATFFVLHEGTRIQMPLIPSEFTRGIDTGVLLIIFILLDMWNLRKHGITPSAVKPQVDYMGHITGYFVGVGAGTIIRAKDPRWRDVERHHFFTERFGKAEKPSSPSKSSG